MRPLLLALLLCLLSVCCADQCNGNVGKKYLLPNTCQDACDSVNEISCICHSVDIEWVCRYDKIVDTIATWVVIVIIVGVLLVVSPCICCCIGICCCGWFGIRASKRRPAQQVVYSQPVYAQAPPSVTINTTTPAYGHTMQQ
uniref:Uncharacterized protein n=1 Tax=Plectus sambesii TaxID=2011161 RepID=A0A914WH94_9BILA